VFIQHSPPDSAFGRACDPDWWITGEVQLLREIDHDLRVLAWQRTSDAQLRPESQREYPERLPLSAAEVKAAKAKAPLIPSPLPIAEMAKWLGWTKPDDVKEE
jgi:hypothetical protein